MTIPRYPPPTSRRCATICTPSSLRTSARASSSSINRAWAYLRSPAALTDASSAVPVLRSISVVVPQARALSVIKMAATGTYAFVGSAQGAIKVNDSVTGQLLAAAVDKRVGGASIKNVAVWQWGDAENAMEYWGNEIDQRLVQWGVQPSSSTAAAN